MIKINSSMVTREFLIEDHTNVTGTNVTQYNFNVPLSSIDHIEVLATILGGTTFFPLNTLRIYGTSNYYGWYESWSGSSLGDPISIELLVADTRTQNATVDLKFRFTQIN